MDRPRPPATRTACVSSSHLTFRHRAPSWPAPFRDSLHTAAGRLVQLPTRSTRSGTGRRRVVHGRAGSSVSGGSYAQTPHNGCPHRSRCALDRRSYAIGPGTPVQPRYGKRGDRGDHPGGDPSALSNDRAQRCADHPSSYHGDHQRMVRRDRAVSSDGGRGLLPPRPPPAGRSRNEQAEEHRDVLCLVSGAEQHDAQVCGRLARDACLSGPRSGQRERGPDDAGRHRQRGGSARGPGAGARWDEPAR